MMLNLFSAICAAFRGCNVWKRISKNFSLQDTIFILVYPGEENLQESLRKHLYSYMAQENIYRIVLLTSDKNCFDSLDSFFEENVNVDVKLLKEKNVSSLLALYNFTYISPRFMIFSVKNLYGRNIEKLACRQGVTNDDLCAYGLFTLKHRKNINTELK